MLGKYLLEPYSILIKAMQRYFTCEGRFGRVYQCHFRLLMHFTGKIPLSLLFYFLRRIGKMAHKFHGKQSQVGPNLFHFYLIKLLVVEELKNKNQTWQAFLDSSKLTIEFPTSPQSKKDTPSSMAKDVQSRFERSVKMPPTSFFS